MAKACERTAAPSVKAQLSNTCRISSNHIKISLDIARVFRSKQAQVRKDFKTPVFGKRLDKNERTKITCLYLNTAHCKNSAHTSNEVRDFTVFTFTNRVRGRTQGIFPFPAGKDSYFLSIVANFRQSACYVLQYVVLPILRRVLSDDGHPA